MNISGLGASLRLGILLSLLSGCAKGRIEDAKDFPSPDGKHVASFLLINFGATVSDCPEVHLRKAGEARGVRGNVFRGYRSFRLKIEWQSSTKLVIYCTPKCEILRHVKAWDGITVSVVQGGNWMLADRLAYLREKGIATTNGSPPAVSAPQTPQ